MDTRLSDPAAIAGRISGNETDLAIPVGEVVERLRAEASTLADIDDFEHLAIEAYTEGNQAAAQYADMVTSVRNVIARELYARQVFVSADVIDLLLVDALKGSIPSPVEAVLTRLASERVSADGLILFPLHDFGVFGEFERFVKRERIALSNASWGIAIAPQSNNLARTIDFIEETCKSFGIAGQVPTELIQHLRRSRPAGWLETNPLLAVSVAQASGYYRTNEPLLMSRIRAATALIAMLATLQPEDEHGREAFGSRVLNNWQTLDIHHYLLLSPAVGESDEMDGQIVPINAASPDVVEMSSLPVELDPAYWQGHDAAAADLYRALDSVYSAYLRYGLDPSDDSERSRQHRKVFESLAYFKCSFSIHRWSAVISLAAAFEMLLIEKPTKSVSKKGRKRIRSTISGAEGKRHADAYSDLYTARSDFVHSGVSTKEVDLAAARRAFVASFLHTAPQT